MKCRQMVWYFWDDDENGEAGRQDEIDPKDPAEESEIGGDGRSEKGFDFFDSRLPRHQEGNQISNFPHAQLDGLWKRKIFNSTFGFRLQTAGSWRTLLLRFRSGFGPKEIICRFRAHFYFCLDCGRGAGGSFLTG